MRVGASTWIYGGTFNLLRHTLPRDGITTTFVSAENPQEFEDAIQENTKLVYFEIFGNPNADLPDLEAISEIAHKHNLPVIVDNTFATPYLFRKRHRAQGSGRHTAVNAGTGPAIAVAGLLAMAGASLLAAVARTRRHGADPDGLTAD